MTDKNASDTENRPKFGSGCLLPFVFFFGFSFYCGVKDGNVAGAIVAFAITAFFLIRFLRPKPRKLASNASFRPNTARRDRRDEDFDDRLAEGFFMAEGLRRAFYDRDDAPVNVDANGDFEDMNGDDF